MHTRPTPIMSALALIILAASTAGAATWQVANNGVDSKSCGLKGACRSISQAIKNAKTGDDIVVGPGVYGDIDGDDAFHSAGDERGPYGGHFSVIWVSKAVRIVSEAGASATVISSGKGQIPTKVLITARGATFGEEGRGFLIAADSVDPSAPYATGIRTAAGTSKVQIGGNVVVQMKQGFQIYGHDHTLAFNRATSNVIGFDVRARHVDLHDNAMIGNGRGITITTDGVSVEHSAVVGNPNGAVDVLDGRTAAVTGNAVLGNAERGLFVNCPGVHCQKTTIAVVGNSLFGNGGAGNCGLVNGKSNGLLAADHNFWGTTAGPGSDPADRLCKIGTATAVTIPHAQAEITVDLPAQH